jgi:hypothetical protein
MWNLKRKAIKIVIGAGDWKHFKITHTISEQRTGKALGQEL